MNMVNEGTVHFRREKHPYDIEQTAFPGGVQLRFRLPKEHVDPNDLFDNYSRGWEASYSSTSGPRSDTPSSPRGGHPRTSSTIGSDAPLLGDKDDPKSKRKDDGVPRRATVSAGDRDSSPTHMGLFNGLITVVAQESGYFGWNEVPSRGFKCIDRERNEFSLRVHVKQPTELRLAMMKRKTGATTAASAIAPTILQSGWSETERIKNSPGKQTKEAHGSMMSQLELADDKPGEKPLATNVVSVSDMKKAEPEGEKGKGKKGEDAKKAEDGSGGEGNEMADPTNRKDEKQVDPNSPPKRKAATAVMQAKPELKSPVNHDRGAYEKFGEPSDVFLAHPAAKPGIPKIRRWWGFPTKVSVSWDTESPDVPIENYQAQFAESPNWSQLWNPEWRDICIKSNRLIVTQLAPENTYWVRVRARNCVGVGDYSQQFEIATSCRGKIREIKKDPSSFTTNDHAVINVYTCDPEGAPIEAIKVERAVYFGPIVSGWEPLKGCVADQIEGDWWRIRLKTLERGVMSRLRLSAINQVGPSDYGYIDLTAPKLTAEEAEKSPEDTKTDAKTDDSKSESNPSSPQAVDAVEGPLETANFLREADGDKGAKDDDDKKGANGEGSPSSGAPRAVGLPRNTATNIPSTSTSGASTSIVLPGKKSMGSPTGRTVEQNQIKINVVASPLPNALNMKVTFSTLENMIVERCKLEYANHLPRAPWIRANVTPCGPSTWEATVDKLEPNGCYRSRVELIPSGNLASAVIENPCDATRDQRTRSPTRSLKPEHPEFTRCVGFSPVFPVFTAMVPDAPWGLRMIEKSPTSLAFLCTTNIPDGAPVTTLQVEVETGWSWEVISKCFVIKEQPCKDGSSPTDSIGFGGLQQSSSFIDVNTNPFEASLSLASISRTFLNATTTSTGLDAAGAKKRKKTQNWKVICYDLLAQSKYNFRVCALNPCGKSDYSKHMIGCTSFTPQGCYDLQVVGTQGYGAKVRWKCDDPEGAPVTECATQVSEDGLLGFTWFHAKGEDLQTREWKGIIQGLLPNKSYVFRVNPVNVVGPGPVAQCAAVFRTAGPPKKAQNLRGYKDGIRFEMQDLMRDTPVLGCLVEYKSQKDKKKTTLFAYRHYKAEKNSDAGVFSTWELLGMSPGLYVISIKGFNCAGWGGYTEANVVIKDPENARHSQEEEHLGFNCVGRKNYLPLFKVLKFTIDWYILHELEKGHSKFLDRPGMRTENRVGVASWLPYARKSANALGSAKALGFEALPDMIQEESASECATDVPSTAQKHAQNAASGASTPLSLSKSTPIDESDAVSPSKYVVARKESPARSAVQAPPIQHSIPSHGGMAPAETIMNLQAHEQTTPQQNEAIYEKVGIVNKPTMPNGVPSPLAILEKHQVGNFHLIDPEVEFIPKKSDRIQRLADERATRYRIACELNSCDDAPPNPEQWLVRFTDFTNKIYRKTKIAGKAQSKSEPDSPVADAKAAQAEGQANAAQSNATNTEGNAPAAKGAANTAAGTAAEGAGAVKPPPPPSTPPVANAAAGSNAIAGASANPPEGNEAPTDSQARDNESPPKRQDISPSKGVLRETSNNAPFRHLAEASITVGTGSATGSTPPRHSRTSLQNAYPFAIGELIHTTVDKQKAVKLQNATTTKERVKLLGGGVVLRSFMLLLHDGINWLERVNLDPLWDKIIESIGKGKQSQSEWEDKKRSWNEKWTNALQEHLPELLRTFDHLLHGVELEHILNLTDAIICWKALGQTCLAQQKRLQSVMNILSCGVGRDSSSMGSRSSQIGSSPQTDVHHVPGDTFMGKAQTTFIGLAAGMVIPVPGALEAWAVSTVMVWTAEDTRFILLNDKHTECLATRLRTIVDGNESSDSTGSSLLANHQSLNSYRCEDRGLKYGLPQNLEDQIEAYLKEPIFRRILVYNQTCRSINLRFENYDGIVQKTVGAVMSAHPMSKFVLGGISAASKTNEEVLWPGELICLNVPLLVDRRKKAETADTATIVDLVAADTTSTGAITDAPATVAATTGDAIGNPFSPEKEKEPSSKKDEETNPGSPKPTEAANAVEVKTAETKTESPETTKEEELEFGQLVPNESDYMKCHLKFILDKTVIAQIDANQSQIISLARLDCGVSLSACGPKDGLEIQNLGYVPIFVKISYKSKSYFDGPIHETVVDIFETCIINLKPNPKEQLTVELREKVEKTLINPVKVETVDVPAVSGYRIRVNGFI